jgi:hypothetical protein
MDLVYILGNGSKWNNNEIKYSLRSVQKYVKGFRKIFIVGEKPDFINGFTHIPFSDDMSLNKERRIMEKISFVCKQKQISSNFLFFNDDFFFLKKISVIKFPYYQKGELGKAFQKRTISDPYRMSLENTFDVLESNKHESTHFDVHAPIIYNKSKFLKVMSQYDWEIPHGYVIKSLYANTLGIEGPYMSDCKISRQLTCSEILSLIDGRLLFTTGERINESMMQVLAELYPKKSKYEK